MNVYISINGVLRNLIQKIDFHYKDSFIDDDQVKISPIDVDDELGVDLPIDATVPFEYKINYPIQNDNILNHFMFNSKEEYEAFLFMEYSLEIFGYAGISYPTAMSDLNKLIYNNPKHNFTIIGLDELGKSKSSTLFFLSKNVFLGNNIKFIKSDDISDEWNSCDVWITDDKNIIDKCPVGKRVVKFSTNYNNFFTHINEINNITQIDLLCLKY